MNFSCLYNFLRKLKKRVFFAICEFDDLLNDFIFRQFCSYGIFVAAPVKMMFWGTKTEIVNDVLFFNILQADISTTA